MRKGIVIAFLLVLAFSIAAGAAVMSRNARSPLNTYLKAEKSALKDISTLLKDTYKVNYNKKGLDKNSVYSVRFEIEAEANASALELLQVPEVETVSALIDKLKLRLDSTVEFEKGESVTDLTLYMNDSPALLGKIYSKGSDLYLGADTLFPDTWFKLGGNVSIEPIARLSAPAKFNERIENVFQAINTYLEDTITKEDVASATEEGTKILTVQLDPARTKMLFQYIVQKLNEAKVLEAYDTQLFQYIQMLMPDQNETDDGLGNPSRLKDLGELTDEFMSRIEITQGLNMELELDGLGNITDRKVSFSLKEEGRSDTAFEIQMSAGSDGKYLPTNGKTKIITESRDGSDYRNEIIIDAGLDLSKEAPQGNLQASLKYIRDGKQDEHKAVLEIGPESTASGKPVKTRGSLSVYISTQGIAQPTPSVVLTFTQEGLPAREYEAPTIEDKKMYILNEMTEAEKQELADQLNIAVVMFMLSSGSLF